jgi:hypothetical protein
MSVGKRIEKALAAYYQKDYESAILQLCPAIDATAKRRQPKDKVGVRFKAFIHEHRSFIYWGVMGWGPRFIFTGDADMELDRIDNTLSKLLYNRARNGMVHDGEFDRLEVIDLGIRLIPEQLGLGRGFILALILAVIGDAVNQREKLERDLTINVGKVSLDLNKLWGKFGDISGPLEAQADAP